MTHQNRTTGVGPAEKNLSEDPVDAISAKSSVVRHGLRDRLLSRMSKILHASVSMREDAATTSIDILLSYMDSEPRKIPKQDLKSVEDTLASIPKLLPGTALQQPARSQR